MLIPYQIDEAKGCPAGSELCLPVGVSHSGKVRNLLPRGVLATPRTVLGILLSSQS